MLCAFGSGEYWDRFQYCIGNWHVIEVVASVAFVTESLDFVQTSTVVSNTLFSRQFTPKTQLQRTNDGT